MTDTCRADRPSALCAAILASDPPGRAETFRFAYENDAGRRVEGVIVGRRRAGLASIEVTAIEGIRVDGLPQPAPCRVSGVAGAPVITTDGALMDVQAEGPGYGFALLSTSVFLEATLSPAFGGPVWSEAFDRTRWRLAETPAPGAVALLATGLAGLVALRRLAA